MALSKHCTPKKIERGTPLNLREDTRPFVSLQISQRMTLHNIIQIHNNVLWHWQYSMKYSWIFTTSNMNNIQKYSMEYYRSHKTLLCIWIMLFKKEWLNQTKLHENLMRALVQEATTTWKSPLHGPCFVGVEWSGVKLPHDVGVVCRQAHFEQDGNWSCNVPIAVPCHYNEYDI